MLSPFEDIENIDYGGGGAVIYVSPQQYQSMLDNPDAINPLPVVNNSTATSQTVKSVTPKAETEDFTIEIDGQMLLIGGGILLVFLLLKN